MDLIMNIDIRADGLEFLPKRAHPTDAGADLFSTTSEWIPAGSQKMIDTGISVRIPTGYMGLVVSRSGQGKIGVTLANSVGIIDSDYRGKIKIILKNNGYGDYRVERADTRVAQLIIVPIIRAKFVEWQGISEADWNDTNRGIGGFGSTGAS